MKSRRIFAAVMAPVVAVSAMAIVSTASADGLTFGEYDYDSGSNIYKVKTSEVSGLKAGDKITIAVSEIPDGAEDTTIVIQHAGWGDLGSNWSNCLPATAGQSVEYTLTADDITAIETNKDTTYGYSLYFMCKDCVISSISVGDVSWAAPVEDESSDTSDESSDTSDESSDDTSSDESSDDTSSDESSDDTSSDESSDDASSDDESSDDEKPAESDDSTSTDDNSTSDGEDNSSETAKPTVIESKLTVGTDVVEGKAVEDIVLVKDGKKYAWKDVESVTFKAEKSFSVQYNVKAGAIDGDAKKTVFVKGKDTLAKASLDSEWGTSWTLNAEDLAAINEAETPNVKLVSKEAGNEITATVTVRAGAAGEDVKNTSDTEKPDNKPTGIALAAAPVILAGAVVAVAVVSKKRK